jgi:poly(3-hydroxybutyrate) depolymerase
MAATSGGAAGAQPPAIAGSGGTNAAAGAGAAGSVASGGAEELLEGTCPANYEVKEGLNRDFPSAGLMRAFYVVPPPDTSKGAAVWVPLTGTEESTDQNLMVQRSGNNQAVAQAGYMVLGPVRICANQDPKITNQGCSGIGPDPYMYIPWRDGASSSKAISHAVYKEAGPDSVFLEEMVRCVAKKYPLLKNKIYLGGISAGGSMTHRALTFNSKFWAGGVPVSGEWRTSAKDGRVLSGNQAEMQMQADAKGIFPGRTPPFPLPTLDSMVVVTIRGGANDTWPGTAYKPDAQAASNFYASQEKVVSVVCMGNWGHQWPKDMGDPNWTNLFNKWVVDLMASHPKGTPPSEFKLTTPPPGAGFSCKLGRFDELYGS